jgi:hypothetical protein
MIINFLFVVIRYIRVIRVPLEEIAIEHEQSRMRRMITNILFV